ncbi:MAG: MG2 domain-containing protein, partial [Myxococcota bacterium]
RFADTYSAELRRGVRVAATLLDAAGVTMAEVPRWTFRRYGSDRIAEVALPELQDGDYILRVDVDTRFESRTLDLEVPLYTPALLHLMTDRPLYKPGQVVAFRAAVLARTDRRPLEERPGKWTVTSPRGLEMMVEKDATGPWGIADSTFPLDEAAETGTWSVHWQSGDDEQTATFEVRRFSLPRLGVTVDSSTPWVGRGDRLEFAGRATYTSGAPVANATVRARLSRTEGQWPMPVDWEDERPLRTDADGRFAVDYGIVPVDLMARTGLALDVAVTEPAGETARGRTRTVLSPESLRLDAVTELGDGVVGGFNNRVYIRVATPDGQPLPGARVAVRQPHDPETTEPRTAVADASGVIAMQIDPGDPITVVDPAPPVRQRPLTPNPPRLDGISIGGGDVPDLALRRALDEAFPAIAACGVHTVGDTNVPVALRADRRGRVTEVMAPPTALGDCVGRAVARLALPRGPIRTLSLDWRVPDSQHPWLRLLHEPAYGNSPQAAFERAALRARGCFPFGRGQSGASVARVHWAVRTGRSDVDTAVEPLDRAGLSRSTRRCLWRALDDVDLLESARTDAMGIVTAVLQVPSTHDGPPPQATTRTAYALSVTATDPDTPGANPLGEGRLVLPVGTLPNVRLRATPSLVVPGEEVTVEILRGPDFVGELPSWLHLRQGSHEVGKARVTDNRARFTVPAEVTGFLETQFAGARTVIFVRSENPLEVAVDSDRTTYRPGETAKVRVRTMASGAPRAAAVGLSGVDETLATLAPLPGPQDLGRVTVRAEVSSPAFGLFDPVALALGQVEGEHAAMATVLRVATLPNDPAGDRPVTTRQDFRADVDTPMTFGFYRALEKATDLVRAWEDDAPVDELLTAERMVRFWARALEELATAGDPAVDGYGRPLTLAVLPEVLLRQVDPRQVASDGTRLPEDVVNWVAYVDTEGRP